MPFRSCIFASMLKIYISISTRFAQHVFTGLYIFLIDDHLGSLWVRLHLSISHDAMRHSSYIPDVGCSSQFEWFVGVWLSEWTNERVSEWLIVWKERACVSSSKKKKKKPTQWSYLIWSEFGPTLIGKDRKFACEPSWRWAAGESTNCLGLHTLCCG